MKKLMVFAVLTAIVGWSQQVDSVTVRQRWPWSKLVDINYVFTAPVGASYDVTVQAFNGDEPLSVPSAAIGGDLYAVTEGARHIVLDPSKLGYTNVQMLTQFKVQLVPAAIPLYMVVDLTKTAGAEGQIEYVYEEALTNGTWGTWERNPVNGVESVIWTGVTNDIYKTDKLVLRRVRAGTFTMGSPSSELGRNAAREDVHAVTLTKDYYIGVFEITQKQWNLVVGSWPSKWSNASYRNTRPVEQVSYYQIRENLTNNSAISPNWPVSTEVGPLSFMGKLRTKVGLAGFDLPTDAQWERACRAGAVGALNDGTVNLTNTVADARLAALGRYQYNGGKINGTTDPATDCTPVNATATVGSYAPNAWGLYDIHGNVWEWCLDWYAGNLGTGAVTDPLGAASGSFCVRRGGGWDYPASGCRSAFRDYIAPEARASGGFRLARILP